MASGTPGTHQRKLGPAPIASFEDLSDEVENGGEPVVRMPGILEVVTPVSSGRSLKTPNTPRIDISRASSSSQQEDSNSRESTPEKELLAGGIAPEGSKLLPGYKEDAAELVSSTEELELVDPVNEQDRKREARRARRRVKDLHDGTQSEHGISIKLSHSERERKDSNCSEIILLNISGRTSRISSVGSQGSAVSGGGLSVVSATSSRSPSPHKCLLETSFCGSVSTLANSLGEPSKQETDDLARLLLKREEDSTRAMIPDSVRVPVVDGNVKPSPLDMPRRAGREERKEIFRREVAITKEVLKRVNIEVPIIKKPKEPDEESPRHQKPATLDLNDKRKRSPSSVSTSSRAALDTPKLQRHQKIRDCEGSRTPSPSSVSRKSSFTSIFKGRGEEESPSTRRPSLASRLRDTADNLRSRSKSRERPTSGDRSPGPHRPDSATPRSRSGSGVFSSTLSLFRKRERNKSDAKDESLPSRDHSASATPHHDVIGKVEFTFNQQQQQQQQPPPQQQSSTQQWSRYSKKDDVIFISLYGENDEFRGKDQGELEVATTLPTDSVAKPPESPSRQFDDYDASSPQQTSAMIVCTDATIEHHRKSRIDRSSRMSSSSGESTRIADRVSQISISESRDSRIATECTRQDLPNYGQQPASENREDARNQRMSTSSSRDSIGKKPDVVKPKRKSKTMSSPRPSEPPPPAPVAPLNGLHRGPDEPAPAPASLGPEPEHNSSESERESDAELPRAKPDKLDAEVADERKGLCYEESFEEELPYVPTTLPMEKSVAVPILPVKQRLHDVRTTPIERPRSTTPINPTLLDEYVIATSTSPDDKSHRELQRRRSGGKMKISLPREDSFRMKSPHRPSSAGSGHSFSEFAGRVPGLSMTKSPSPPPPVPPRAPTTVLTTVAARHRPANWINFEEIPEKRKPPKRIQTVPRVDHDDPDHSQPGPAHSGQYNYVQPEECHCECHGESRRASLHRETGIGRPQQQQQPACAGNDRHREPGSNGVCNGANCTAAQSASADRSSIISDNSSLEESLSMEYTPSSGLVPPRPGSGSRPFAMDLDVSSNRSSIISQEETEDDHQ